MRESARQAAAWWAKRLAGESVPDNGDTLQSAVMADAALKLANKYTEEQVRAFELALGELIDLWLLQRPSFVIRNDYDPAEILAEAAKKTGIKLSMFDIPTKTRMRIDAHSVTVGAGYRSPVQLIWEDAKGAAQRLQAIVKDAQSREHCAAVAGWEPSKCSVCDTYCWFDPLEE